jgi:hypothetical protein
MLTIARQQNQNVRWIQGDIREANPSIGTTDMVLGLDVMNELNSLKEIEQVFTQAYQVLETGKLFIFDMFTIEGLTHRGAGGDQMTHYDSLTIITNSQYDYDRQMLATHYTIFESAGDLWRRSATTRILRAFPVAAVVSLLQRQRFNTVKVLTLEFEPFDSLTSHAPRVIFSAQKD